VRHHGKRRFTWSETYARCRKLASALAKRGIGHQAIRSAVMLANTPEITNEFGVPFRRVLTRSHRAGRRDDRLHARSRRR